MEGQERRTEKREGGEREGLNIVTNRPCQIILIDSRFIVFFYFQKSSPLFFQISPLFSKRDLNINYYNYDQLISLFR